jgi:Transcriptional regulator, AbiEi antitoxin
MGARKLQPWARDAWRLARRQHGVVARSQLLALGMSAKAIRHRLRVGRLHEMHRGVYAVGRPGVGPLGRLMAAVLACGPGAQLSHRSGAALWGIRRQRGGLIDVAVPSHVVRNRPGIVLHRRAGLRPPRFVSGIPVGDPTSILIDLGAKLPVEELEDAVNEADRLTYHRTASQQAVDIRRDQAHVRTGLRTLRFTHPQVFFQPDYVREVLEDTVRNLK